MRLLLLALLALGALAKQRRAPTHHHTPAPSQATQEPATESPEPPSTPGPTANPVSSPTLSAAWYYYEAGLYYAKAAFNYAEAAQEEGYYREIDYKNAQADEAFAKKEEQRGKEIAE